MSNKRKVTHQQKRIEQLEKQIKSLETENKILKQENESFKKINNIEEYDGKTFQNELNFIIQRYYNAFLELYDLKSKYSEVILQANKARKKYTSSAEYLIKQMKEQFKE